MKAVKVIVALFLLLSFVANNVVVDDQPDGYIAVSPPQPESSYSYVHVASAAPNDNYFDKQWGIAKIQAPECWQITSGTSDILVAILDTGIDKAHQDLIGKVAAEINFTSSPTVSDVYGHGTHIAGIIAAITNNGLGVAGVAPECQLMNVKVAADDGSCDADAVAKGIVWAVDNGARVINLSLNIAKPHQTLEEAVDYAWSHGAIIVAASSNWGITAYPAYYSNCLGVAAIGEDGLLVPLSNYEDWVNVAAPGANIYSTLPDNTYDFESGTSMATGFVSGVAALLFSVVTDIDGDGQLNDEVRAIIEASYEDTRIARSGSGCVNAFSAIAQATENLSTSPTGRIGEVKVVK